MLTHNKAYVKIVTVCLVIAMIITMLPNHLIHAEAEDETVRFRIETATAKPGDVVDLKVVLNNAHTIKSMTISNIVYDETAVTLLNVEWLCDAFIKSWNNNEGRGVLTYEDNTLTNGPVLKISFKVNDAIDDIILPISCSMTAKVLDISGTEVSLNVEITSGSIQIFNAMRGDVDGNGKKNSNDCVYLLYNVLFGNEDYPINQNGDMDGNGKVNSNDAVYLLYHVLFGEEDYPLYTRCIHDLTHFNAIQATCTEDGNIEYWHCSICGKYYSDANAVTEISLEDVTVKAAHVLTYHAYVAPTYTEIGNREYWKCSVCNKYFENEGGTLEAFWEDLVINKLQREESAISYDIYGTDNYLRNLGVINPNPDKFITAEGLVLLDLVGPEGYIFRGWKNSSGSFVTSIAPGTQSGTIVYAQWEEHVYNINYNVLNTPVESLIKITDDYDPYHFTVSKGKPDLPNPVINNYVFLGWFDEDGNEVLSIPAGVARDVTLTPFYSSMRYLAKSNPNSDKHFLLDDYANDRFYYIQEIGTIENIPLANLWQSPIMSRAGLDSTVSKTVSVSISQTQANTIAEQITKSTTDSNTWTLARDWNNTTQVNKETAESNGYSQAEATTQAMSSSGTISLTDSLGGKNTVSKTDGTTVLTYDTKEKTKGNSQQLDVGLSGEMGLDVGLKDAVPIVKGGAEAKASAHIDGKFEWHNETTTKTGTETTKVNTRVEENELSWNKSMSQSLTQQASLSTTLSTELSRMISEKYGYGESYSEGGSNSESRQTASSQSDSLNSSSTITYSVDTIETETQTFHSDGKIEGKYMLVQAGTAHVFAVVGYDISTKSFFTYTFSVMDDTQYQYLDYSPNTGNFDDCQYSVLPFEIPGFMYDYVAAMTACTDGLSFRTNSETRTATVIGYTGTQTDVVVPNYIVRNNLAYKVTGFNASVFSGKNITSIVLSDFINEIPAEAFKNCNSLTDVIGEFTIIGDDAFSGCTLLEGFCITNRVTAIGSGAFTGVPNVKAVASSPTIISDIFDSGAQNVIIDISDVESLDNYAIEIPEIGSVELIGGSKTYSNLEIESHASETILRQMRIVNSESIPLVIYSEELLLDTVSAQSASYVLMLHENGVNVSLLNDSGLVSNSGNALVCKNPSFISVQAESVAGYLRVNGNIYCCGSLTGIDNIELSGSIILISESDFERYIKGTFTVSFNANGGSINTSSLNAYCGVPLGTLPTPSRDYYTFDGWYTEANGGTRVTSDTVYPNASNVVLYAHWTIHPLSGWVPASQVPAGASVVERKWTYTRTQTTESTSSTLTGWEQVGSYWNQVGTGSANYASFPEGFDQNHTIYTSFAKAPFTASETSTTKREVSNSWTGYVYWHWMYSSSTYSNNMERPIYNKKGIGPATKYNYTTMQAVLSSIDHPQASSGYVEGTGLTSYDVRSEFNTFAVIGHTPRCFRFDYYTSTYTDYQKVFQYMKVTNEESTTQITSGGEISNVVEMVRYRTK